MCSSVRQATHARREGVLTANLVKKTKNQHQRQTVNESDSLRSPSVFQCHFFPEFAVSSLCKAPLRWFASVGHLVSVAVKEGLAVLGLSQHERVESDLYVGAGSLERVW